MSSLSPALAHLLPADAVGTVTAIQPLPRGPSGSSVYAVSSDRGELVLRVQPAHRDAGEWAQQLRVLRRAAAAGVAPALVHVDDDARAVVVARVAGEPLPAVLGDPARRGAALAGVVEQLSALHAVSPDGIEVRDPLAYARAQHAGQRGRPGFPDLALTPVLEGIEAGLASEGRRVVSHNDLNPGNVLWDGARAWLVDWEVAGLTHPFYDLATLAMFIRLDEAAALELLGAQEGRALAPEEVVAFAALRRLAALLCGLTFLAMMPDLALLPPEPPSLAAFYADLRAGTASLADARGQGAFGLALLALAIAG